MSKNSPEPEGHRLPTDGAIPTVDLSPILGGEVSGGPGGEEDSPHRMTFMLAEVQSAALRQVLVGQGIDFDCRERRIVALAGQMAVGYVPPSHVRRVRRIMESESYAAWVSDVGHRAVSVTVEW